MDLGLSGKTALVTGSYRGTGSAIAMELAREGARVFVHGFEAGQPDAVVESICEAGFQASGVVGDINCDAGADDVVEAVNAGCERVDVLVNNYGVAEGGRWQGTSTDAWVELYQKNVLSGVRMVHAFSPPMRAAGWGRIIWLGTIGSTRPAARMPHYYAAKATLPNVCVSLAKELAGTGITVNLVSPGIIATAEVKAALTKRAAKMGWGDDWAVIAKEGLREMLGQPFGRIAETEEVAALVAFVASEQAAAISGTNLRIDGGSTDTAL
jgi:3-oxoacyl-[acyl-carrier protein] reductase